MRTTATSATLPLTAAVGDGNATASATLRLADDGLTYDLTVTLDHAGQAPTAEPAALPPADIAEVVDFIRNLDPRQLADAVDRASTSLADDPVAILRDLIAQMVDQTFTPEPAP